MRLGDRGRMTSERVEWLRRLSKATRHAANDLRALGDEALHADLLRDLDDFHSRLVTELADASATNDGPGR